MPRSKPSATGNSESRRTNVLLEGIRKEVRLIAENHLALRTDIDRIKSRSQLLDVLHSEFQTFKGALLEIAGDVKVLKGDVAELKRDVKVLKADVATLKTDVKDLTTRLTTIEAK